MARSIASSLEETPKPKPAVAALLLLLGRGLYVPFATSFKRLSKKLAAKREGYGERDGYNHRRNRGREGSRER